MTGNFLRLRVEEGRTRNIKYMSHGTQHKAEGKDQKIKNVIGGEKVGVNGIECWEHGRERVSILYMIIRRALSEKIFEWRTEENNGTSYEDIWRKIVPERRHSRCKGPKTGTSLVCLKSNKGSVAVVEWTKAEVQGVEVKRLLGVK